MFKCKCKVYHIIVIMDEFVTINTKLIFLDSIQLNSDVS